MNSWRNILLQIDLVNAAKYFLKFLKNVDKLSDLYEGCYFQRALYRYEFIWLPMLKSFKNDIRLIPPIDVQWVWYLHMLSPVDYIDDMKVIVEQVLNTRPRSEADICHFFQYSKNIWENFSKTIYDYRSDTSVQQIYKSKIKYDLKSASLKQKGFVYQVSLPHFENEEFLRVGLERYKKFLYLSKLHPDVPFVTCFLIEIMIRTHQFHPFEYKNDTKRIFSEKVVTNEDYCYNGDESHNSNIFFITRKLWQELFHEEFLMPGAMFRGYPKTLSNLYILNPIFCDLQTFSSLKQDGIFKLKKIKIKNKHHINDDKKIFQVNLYRVLKNEIETIATSKMRVGSNKWFSSNFFTFSEEALESCTIKIEIEESNLIKDIFKSEKLETTLNCRIYKPKIENQIETQYSNITFSDKNQKNSYLLSLEWEVVAKYKRKTTFYLESKKFSDNFETKQQLICFRNQNIIFDIQTLTSSNHDDFNLTLSYLDNSIATSTLINHLQLPAVKYEEPVISLSSENEIAMLIRNSSGDYAILKASIAETPLSVFKIEWYSFEINAITSYKFTDPFHFIFKNPENTMTADLDIDTGIFNINFKENASRFESFLACILSIVHLSNMVKFNKKRKVKGKSQTM